MPFNVSEFAANIGSSGLAKTSTFTLSVFGSILGIGMSEVQNAMQYRCDTVSFPGRLVNTSDHFTYGPTQKIGYGQSFDTVEATIMLSENFREKLFFERWQDSVVGFARGTMTKEPGLFDIGYYDDYVGTVEILQYDALGDLIYKARLLEAWPVQIADMPVNWADDDIQRVTVSFAFRYFVDDEDFKEAVDAALADSATDGSEAASGPIAALGPGADLLGDFFPLTATGTPILDKTIIDDTNLEAKEGESG